jgi:hypothetical protein
MRMHVILCLCASVWWLAACDSGPDDAALPPVGASQVSIAGLYDVQGTTVEKLSGNEREISGTIVLDQDGGQYTTNFSLKTTYPNPDGPARADVIGTGEGTVEGRTLRGVAETQLVMASVPGVDTKFAFVPRIVGPRIVSSSVGKVEEDGTITIEIENRPAEGEDYPPTRTILRGSRVPR